MMGRISFVAACLLTVSASAGQRPYEFDWAKRTADEFPPLARLERTNGWTVCAQDAAAALSNANEHVLFGEGVVQLSCRPTGARPSVALRPDGPLACADGFDTVSVWVWGDRIGSKGRLSADFRDASGAAFSVPMYEVRHKQWHCQIGVVTPELRPRTAKGAVFTGLTLALATNESARTLAFTSLCVFRDPQRPLEASVRPKRGVQLFADAPQGHNVGAGRLPFPNRRETIVPPAREVAGLEFRLPKDGAVDWSDLAFRVDGGAWIPLAVGGGLYPQANAEGAKVRFSREANSVVATVEAPAGVEEVRFGAGKFPADSSQVVWPYYTFCWCDHFDVPGYERGGIYEPKTETVTVGRRTLSVAAMFDWTQSAASAPSCRDDATNGLHQLCCALMYVPKTDGRRNRVFERFVWTVGEDPSDVFPVVPNPESPWKRVTGTHVWRAHPASDDRQQDYAYWQGVRDAGLRHVIVNDHECGWRDENESFTFRTRPAPKKGGDRGQYDYARFMIDKLGFRYGPYNNFTDFAPVNGHWSLDHVGRSWNGELERAWQRCYSPKSTWAVGMCERLAPEIQRKFRFNTAYCDVHTCVTPWLRNDYDSRSPGAGTFAQVFYDYGEIMLIQKAAWNGPVYSEGGFQWWYVGLTDGNYAQTGTYGLYDKPWLVDFDLTRLHDKCCNFGIGNLNMFGGRGLGSKRQEERKLRFLAATIAFGHPGFLLGSGKPGRYDDERTSYFLVQGIAAKYTQASVREIRYADATGKLYATGEALANGAWRRSQLRIVYSDGTEVAVNGNQQEPFRVSVKGVEHNLPPNGWCAISGDGTAGSLNEIVDGVPLQRAWSDEYRFVRKDGVIEN